ncbi:MAG TPA: acyltransferase family protein [Polyangiaceae bacterium]|nr:acyltransferase family protein [Polyangiaceae bacterium]
MTTRALPQPSSAPLSSRSPASGERRSRPPLEPVPPAAPQLPAAAAAERSLAAPARTLERKLAGRVHHLDFLRASMMILGVFVHASHADYDLGDYEGIRFFSGSFRMACFFLISGYFSAAMLERYSGGQYLRRRLLSLGVPALFTVLVLNPPALAAMQHYFASAPLPSTPTVNWHLHVWFLFVLMLYSLSARPLLRVWQVLSGWLNRLLGEGYVEALGVALVTAAASVVLKALEKWGTALPAFDQYSEILCASVEDLPYFAFGLLMQRSARVFRFAHARPWLWGALAIGLLGPRYWLELQPITTTPQHLLHLALDYATAFACSFALLSAAERWMRAPRRWVTWTAASAYTIYIVHYLVISLTLLYTQRAGLVQPLRAAAAALVALVVGYAAHFGLVERVPLLALLLNGRLAKRAQPAAQRAVA